MADYYNIEFDGIDGLDSWYDYRINSYYGNTWNHFIKEVEKNLKELGGGHADIFNAETDDFVCYVEV